LGTVKQTAKLNNPSSFRKRFQKFGKCECKKGVRHLRDLAIDRQILIHWTSKKPSVRVMIGFIFLEMVTGDRLLPTW
jgi:hypothetical protein